MEPRLAMEPRRPQALDAGLMLLVVAVPLAFTPFSRSPFADPKLVLLAVGTLLVWIGAPPVDRRLALAASVWIGVTVVAAVAGVDPLRSLTGLDSPLSGVVLLLPCAYLVVAGAGLDAGRAERIRRWLVWVGLAMAAVLTAWRLAPDAVGSVVHDLSFVGSTAGNPVFAAGVMTVSLVAALGDRGRSVGWRLAVAGAIATGISLGGERSSWALPLVAVPVALWWMREPPRRALAIGVGVLAVFVLWGVVDATGLLPEGGASPAGQIASVESDVERFIAFDVDTRAWLERPVLGWGPGEGSWSAYRATATPGEIARTGPSWNEAHNLIIQTAVTTGAIGLASLLWLAWIVASRARRADRRAGWLVGAGAGLAAFSMFEPFSLSVTPLLFLLAGAAGGSSGAAQSGAAQDVEPGGAAQDVEPAAPGSWARAGRGITGVLLAGLVVLSLDVIVASTLEQWGHLYDEEWALRRSVALQPWRLSAIEGLVRNLALNGREGDAADGADARRIARDSVARHPWDPQIRYDAADVELLLRNPAGAPPWIRAQLERFPGDRGLPELSGFGEATGSSPQPTVSP